MISSPTVCFTPTTGRGIVRTYMNGDIWGQTDMHNTKNLKKTGSKIGVI